MNRRLLAFIVGSLIMLTGHAQTAGISALPSVGCSPLPVVFSDASTGATSWLWDFGDGTTSTVKNPGAHLYTTPNTYTVKLTINGSIATSTTITVNASPVANFSANNTSGCFPLPVQFTDNSSAGAGTIVSWSWDFGDGDTSALQNPAHTYTAAANFPVTLKVVNSVGCANTITLPGYIKIGSGVTANFTTNAAAGCKTPITVDFTNNTIGPGTMTYQWNFGDGVGTSTQQNPVYNYSSSGTYNVQLIATSSLGCIDTLINPVQVSSGNVHSSFTAPDSVCGGATFSLVNTSTPIPTVSNWDFGDGTTSALINPTKSYSATGTYTIKLVNTFGTCVDSITKQIFVGSAIVADFTANDTSSCTVPFTVNFTDKSQNAINWLWDFGDGSNSSVQNPTHTYSNYGTYTVALQVTNSLGCTRTVSKSPYILIIKPYVKITTLPGYGCLPYTFNPVFTDSAIYGTITSYLWDFGDGTTSTSATPPSHLYSTAGVYPVKLTLTISNGCTATTVDTVKVGTMKPTPAFTASSTNVCASSAVQFTDQSTGSPNQWLWNFGDGVTSGSQNPSHVFTKTGTFSIKLIVYNNGCGDSITKTAYITVNPPIAKFGYSFNCAVNAYQYSFTDQSTGADTWDWDFGDGSPHSNVQNPTHLFASTTTSSTVTLTVTNNASGCSSTIKQTIQIVTETIAFLTGAQGICKNTQALLQVSVSDISKVASFSYDFGDGTVVSSYTLNIFHVYKTTGTFTVTLTVTDINGCKTTISQPLFKVYGPTAQFIANNPNSCTPYTASFTDQSVSDGINNIVNWIWDFGDGTPVQSFNGPPFTHNYTSQGIYSVKLKVVDAFGCSDSVSKTNYITVAAPKAIFSAVDSLSCPGSAVQFINNSSGYGLTYKWDFGDGSTSTAISPSHAYAIGNYTVGLLVTDQFGCTDFTNKTNYITVNSPVASFTVDNTVASCPPLKANFTFTGSYYQSVKWLFGDGGISSLLNPTHFYTIPGIYYDTLIVTSHGGCTDTAAPVKIQVFGPYGVFNYSPLQGCHNLTVNFNVATNNVVKYIWDFNNGQSQTTTVPSTTYTYDTAGKYAPVVVLQDATGCSVPVFGTDTIVVVGSHVNFGYDKNILCNNGTVQFSDSTITTGVITNYAWDFGDGSTSAAQNPSHYFAATGLYTIKLVVTAQTGCQDSVIKTGLIKVVANPTVDINGANSQCVPATISFLGVEVVADTSALTWSWNFFNGQTSSQQNPAAQNYTVAGNDSVQLIATNSSSCADTVKKNFTIYPLPPTYAGADTIICLGQSAQLNATGAATYTWAPPATLSCTNCANPLATPTSKTTYIVTGTSAFGCVLNDTVLVNVVQPGTLTVSPLLDTICIGQSVNITASGEDIYTWTPSAGLSNPNIANPVATPDTTTIYQLTATDSLFCFTNTQSVDIVVYNYPTINLGPDVTLPVGSSYQVPGIGSPDIVSITWTPTTGLSCIDCITPVASPVNSTEYIVKVANIAGCSTSDSLNIIVTCNNSNLFVPNTFSPNGDGMNDVFYVRGKGLSMVQSMRIFNRWGQMIFEKRNFAPNDPSAGWDGTFNGKKMPVDVYVYTIEVVCENSVVVPYHGNVALIR